MLNTVTAVIRDSIIQFQRLRMRAPLGSFGVQTFWLRGGVTARRVHSLQHCGGRRSDHYPAEVKDDLRRALFLRDPNLLDAGDETGLGEHLVPNPEIGEFISLLLLVLLHRTQKGQPEEHGNCNRIGKRQQKNAAHGVFRLAYLWTRRTFDEGLRRRVTLLNEKRHAAIGGDLIVPLASPGLPQAERLRTLLRVVVGALPGLDDRDDPSVPCPLYFPFA